MKRVYDPIEHSDGARVLVDRLWPRGLKREEAHLDDWCRAIAPSTQLREWYGHRPERFQEFSDRYDSELGDPERSTALASLVELSRHRPLTLLTATRTIDFGHATLLTSAIRDAADAEADADADADAEEG